MMRSSRNAAQKAGFVLGVFFDQLDREGCRLVWWKWESSTPGDETLSSKETVVVKHVSEVLESIGHNLAERLIETWRTCLKNMPIRALNTNSHGSVASTVASLEDRNVYYDPRRPESQFQAGPSRPHRNPVITRPSSLNKGLFCSGSDVSRERICGKRSI